MIPYMGHNNAIDRYFWRAVPLSLLLHLLLGVWFARGITVMRQVATPQVISVELREAPPSPRPPPAARPREPALRPMAAPVVRAKAPVIRPPSPQLPNVSRQVPPAVHVPEAPVEAPLHPLAQAAVVRPTDMHKMATSMPALTVKADAKVVRPVEQAVPAKDTGRAEAVAKAYFSRVRSHLERNKEYPALALRGRLEGTVTVRFTIRNDGSVGSAGIVKSSGYNLLDQSALRTVHISAPFPNPPETPGFRETSVSVPLVYKMDL
ncbi:MAG: energy transducer TonB [Deltaproteobacteria bacterium]|nr:energy transducer TonB [Deltaproteobacteria bacterium]